MSLRIIEKFLWLPKKDNNKWYWLKKVPVVERKVIYNVIEWPLIPWGFGGPWKYQETEYKFVGIFDPSSAIEVFIPDRDCP